jgi:hypothetical protein
MNVAPLATISRKRRRRRPLGGSDRLTLRSAQRNAADRRADLPQLVIETDAFQQPSGVWVDRDPGSDLPENLGLLEYGCIETSCPKRERGGQTSDTAADDCDAKRTRHFSQTLAVSRNHGTMRSCQAVAVIRGNTWPMRQEEIRQEEWSGRR